MKLFNIFLIAVVLFAFTFCKKDKPTTPNEVFLSNSVFDPVTLTVESGTTITWINKESMIHTVTSDSMIFNSNDMSKDKTFSWTFNTKGTYAYRCLYHSNMKGTVIVQ